MYRPGTATWGVRFDGAPLLLHAALYVRDGAGVALTDHPDDPPRLLTAPPALDLTVDGPAWLRWWRSVCEVPATGLSAQQVLTAYDRHAPAGVAGLDDAPLIWASREVKQHDPFQPPRHELPALKAVRRLGKETGKQSPIDVRMEGLAVEGDWRYVSPDGSLILASWAALDRMDEWLTDALGTAWLAE